MNYLIHYGIKGQVWGKRNGPPYPLSYKDHSAKEKRQMSQTQKPSKSRFSVDKKRLIKDAAIAAGVALAVVGGYALHESGALEGLVNLGRDVVRNVDLDGAKIPKGNFSQAGGTLKTIAEKAKAGASPEQLKTQFQEMISSINASNKGSAGHDNCYSCSLSYVLNRLFGGNFTAFGSDVLGDTGKNIDDILGSVFKKGTINKIDPSDHLNGGLFGVKFDQKLVNLVPNGSTGILRFSDSDGNGHVANYEKTLEGVFSLVENQHGRIFSGDSLSAVMNNVPGYKFVQGIYDLSGAELSDSAPKVLETLVKK